MEKFINNLFLFSFMGRKRTISKHSLPFIASVLSACTTVDYTTSETKSPSDDAPIISVDLPPTILTATTTPNPVDNTSTVTLDAYVTDDFGVDFVIAEVNGSAQQMEFLGEDRFSLTLDAGILPIEEHFYTVTAFDTIGQEASRTDSFVVQDIIPPVIVQYTAEDTTNDPTTTFTITTKVTDIGSGIDKVYAEFNADGNLFSFEAQGDDMYSLIFSGDQLEHGQLFVTLTANDNAGLEAFPETFSVNVYDVTNITLDEVVATPDVISTADLADAVAITARVSDAYYPLSELNGNCTLDGVELGELSFDTNSASHRLSFIPDNLGIGVADIGGYTILCSVDNPSGFTATQTTTITFYDGIAPEITCEATQDGKNDGSVNLELTCEARDEYLLAGVSWNEGTLGSDSLINSSGDTWVASIDATDIPAASYAITVAAYDSTGNNTLVTISGTVHDAQAPEGGSCILSDYVISNEEGATTTLVCAGITDETESDLTVTFDAGFISGTLTNIGFGTYTEKITVPRDTAATEYRVAVEISDGTNTTTYTLSSSLTLEDQTAPHLSCAVTLEGNNGGSANLEFTCTATDETSLSTVEANESTLGTETLTNISSDTFTGSFDVTGVAAGTYAMTVTAYDSAGNTTAVDISGTVNDTQIPTISCSLSEVVITNNTSTGTYPLSTIFTCTAQDESSISAMEYDAGTLGAGAMSGGSGSYFVTFSASDKVAMDYPIIGTVIDDAGHTATSSAVLIVIDETAPIFTSVSVTPSSVINDGTESFTIDACVVDETDGTELGTGIAVAIDSYTNNLAYDSSRACYGITVNGDEFSEGTYTLELTATDAAGNSAEDRSGIISVEPTIYTTSLFTDTDTRTSEESPTTNYNGNPLYVGASSSGKGRSYVSFDSTEFESAEILSAALTIYAAGGTCHSSSNNHDCNHDLVIDAHEITAPWDAATLTWNSAPSYDSTVVDSMTMNEAYGGGGSYTFDITSLVQTWADGTNYGVLLKADSTGESTSNQVDAGIESYETGSPTLLEVTYR